MAEPIKYLDYNGLSHFWSKIKTYIDDNSGSVSDIVWNNSSNMNNYTEQGIYFISGTHSNSGDNMPTTVASDCNIGAFLIVTVSTTDSSTRGKVVGQHLILSNRLTNETKEYTRTYSYTIGELGSWSNWNEVSYVGRMVDNGGEIFNDYTNNKATGKNSHAEGSSTTASGQNSHAEGNDTTASKDNSHAEGFNTKASEINAHAEGMGTTASGDSSHAEGVSTTASGAYTHAEGNMTTASGIAAHAEGNSANAEGENSHAEGNSTNAYNDNEHAEGSFNKSYKSSDSSVSTIHTVGIGNFTEKNAHEIKLNGDHYVFGLGGFDGTNSGTAKTLQEVIDEKPGKKVSGDAKGEIFNNYVGNTASGQSSHAEGTLTTASGRASHAEGSGSNASGIAAHAEGQYTIAYKDGEHAEGIYNKSYNSTTTSTRVIHSVGIGSSTSNRKNAHEIKFNGDHYVYGIGDYDGTNSGTAVNLQDFINYGYNCTKTVSSITGYDETSSTASYTLSSTDLNYNTIILMGNNGSGKYANININTTFLNSVKTQLDKIESKSFKILLYNNVGIAYLRIMLNNSDLEGSKWGGLVDKQVSLSSGSCKVITNIPLLSTTSGYLELGGGAVINVDLFKVSSTQYVAMFLCDRTAQNVNS